MYDVILFFIVWQSEHATYFTQCLFRSVSVCVCVYAELLFVRECDFVMRSFVCSFNACWIYGNTSNNFRCRLRRVMTLTCSILRALSLFVLFQSIHTFAFLIHASHLASSWFVAYDANRWKILSSHRYKYTHTHKPFHIVHTFHENVKKKRCFIVLHFIHIVVFLVFIHGTFSNSSFFGSMLFD